jgi:hypothetical protein
MMLLLAGLAMPAVMQPAHCAVHLTLLQAAAVWQPAQCNTLNAYSSSVLYGRHMRSRARNSRLRQRAVCALHELLCVRCMNCSYRMSAAIVLLYEVGPGRVSWLMQFT